LLSSLHVGLHLLTTVHLEDAEGDGAEHEANDNVSPRVEVIRAFVPSIVHEADGRHGYQENDNVEHEKGRNLASLSIERLLVSAASLNAIDNIEFVGHIGSHAVESFARHPLWRAGRLEGYIA